MGKLGMRNNKMLVFMCINLTNLCCHSVYSVLAAFFPQEADKKGLSEDAVGIVFASFAAVIFLCSPMAGGWMTHYGKVWVYITGIVLVALSTILFAGATTMPDGSLFGSYCLIMRLLQGVGSAMEEVRAHCAPRCSRGHWDARTRPLFRLRPASAPPPPPPPPGLSLRPAARLVADGGVRDHRRPRPGEHLLLSGDHRDLDGPRLHGPPRARLG